jgi:hypothetical protein
LPWFFDTVIKAMKELLFQLFEVTLAFYGSPVNAHQASGSELLSTITQLDKKKKTRSVIVFCDSA